MEEILIENDEKLVEVPLTPLKEEKVKKSTRKKDNIEEPMVSCLRNDRVFVKYIPKTSGIWGNNPKHVLAGGMAETAVKTFTVPRLESSGMFVNVLTNSEKDYLEEVMGLEYNALSVYKKENNFWDDSNPEGISNVRLTKQGTYLDLSNPEDYIRYKILLANKNYIAPSLKALHDTPKATYQFVIIEEGEENKAAKNNMSNTMRCYAEYGKIENEPDKLRMIIELITSRPLAPNTKIEYLQTKINELIQLDSKIFLSTITDPLLNTKVLLKQSIEAGTVSKRGDYYYLRSDNTPLCENNEDPTLSVAAKFLNKPKHQDILFTLQAKLK